MFPKNGRHMLCVFICIVSFASVLWNASILDFKTERLYTDAQTTLPKQYTSNCARDNQTNIAPLLRMSERDEINYTAMLLSILAPSKKRITLVVNSCGRLDLLDETLSSFLKYYPHSTYPLYEKIIIDDCRNKSTAHILIDRYMPEFEIMFTANNEFEKSWKGRDKRITNSIDKTHKQIETEWIYHLEDDWMFNRTGFIQEAFDIFEYGALSQSNDKYSIVLCWNMKPGNHQNGWVQYPAKKYKNSVWYTMTYMDRKWGGFTFNSGLYPAFIYNKYGPFRQAGSEKEMSIKMQKDKLHVGLLYPSACNHIGDGLQVHSQYGK